jgi:hypothetical protein
MRALEPDDQLAVDRPGQRAKMLFDSRSSAASPSAITSLTRNSMPADRRWALTASQGPQNGVV